MQIKIKEIFSPISFHEVLIFIAFLTILTLQVSGIAKDPGLGWHLETGKRVFETKSFIYTDNLLASSEVRPWIANQWLSDLILYAIYKYFNWWGLYVFTIFTFTFIFFGILYQFLLQYRIKNITASLILILAFKASQIHLIIRPLTFSFLALALLLYFLSKRKPNEKLSSLKLFLLFAFWANTHPSFFVGFLTIAIFGIVELFYKNIRSFFHFFYIGAISLLATLFNPYTYKLHLSALWLTNSFAVNFYQEWQPITINKEAFEFFLLISFISIFSILTKPKKNLLALQILTLIFAYLSFNSIRMLPYFSMFACYPAAYGFGYIIKLIISRNNLNLVRKASLSLCIREKKLNLIDRVFLLAFIIMVISYPKLPLFHEKLGPPRKIFPYTALDYLNEHKVDNSVTLFHTFDWGGFISFYGKNHIKATVDDRSKLLGEAFVMKYMDVLQNKENYLPLLKELKATHVLIKKNSKLSLALKKDKKHFILLFEDTMSVLYKII